MAQFTSVPTQLTGDTWTAANANTYWQQNFESVRPDFGTATATDPITITNSTDTLINFLDIKLQSVSFFSTDSLGRLTFPYAGVFHVVLQTDWSIDAVGIRQLFTRASGSTVNELISSIDANTGSIITTVQKIILTSRNNADYWEIGVFQDSGGNLDVDHFQIDVATMRNDSTA